MNASRKLLLASALVLAGIAGACAGPAARGSFDRTLTVSGPVELYLTNGSGSVHIGVGPPGQVHVQGQFSVWAWFWGNSRRRVTDLSENPPIRQEGSLIRVGFQRYGPWEVSTDYVIDVPPESEVHAATGSGDLSIHGLTGPVNATAGSGGVDLSQIQGDVLTNTGSGDIRADGIKGSVMFKAGVGGIVMINISGPVRASAGSGDITLTSPGDTVSMRTGSGDIRVTGASADLRIHTGTGEITVAGAPAAASYWELRTGTGDVQLDVPPGAGFRLYAQTRMGEIRFNLPLTILERGPRDLRAVFGAGSARVEVNTGTGDIRLNGAQP